MIDAPARQRSGWPAPHRLHGKVRAADPGLTGPYNLAILARMRRVSVTELKNQLSRYLRLVKRGETIEILERSVPVARLEGVPGGSRGEGHLERLRRDGITLPPKRRARTDLLKDPPVPCRADAIRAVIDERGDR
jgi:prevent-host-death family protein